MDQSYETEAARLDRLFERGWPTMLGEEFYPRGMGAAFGFVAVVRPSDYRAWWKERGHKVGAPDPDILTPTEHEHQVSMDASGKPVLVPVIEEA